MLKFLWGFCIFLGILLPLKESRAALEPRMDLKTSFYSIQETDSAGTSTTAAASYKFDEDPGLALVSAHTGAEIDLRANIQEISLSPPAGFGPITGSPAVFFGGGVVLSLKPHPYALGLGVSYGQRPLLELDKTQQFLSLSKVVLPSFTADLSYTIIAYQGWAFRVGGGGQYDLSSTSSPSGLSISHGDGFTGHFDLEYRRELKVDTLLYYSYDKMTLTQGSASTTEIGLCLKFSFLGLRGMNAPQEERE